MEDGIDNHQNIHCELYGTTPGWNIPGMSLSNA